jgi:Holliday junction DNA helicase RuvB
MMNNNQIDRFNLNLYPTSLSEYIGNEQIKTIIAISINACKEKKLNVGHMLITGPRGTGKSTLARLIAIELGLTYKIISANAIDKLNDLNILFTNLPQMLIIDEIHNIKPAFSDLIHEALDNYIFTYADEDNQMVTIKLKPFTMVGITTDEGKLTAPLYSRFQKKYHLMPYTPINLQKIVMNISKNNNIDISADAAYEIALRSGGIPRIAIVHFVRYNKGIINHKYTIDCLDLHGIDKKGLNNIQREILKTLSSSKTPMGVENLSQRIGVGVEALTKIYEPPLLSIGFIKRSSTGREITNAGRAHITSQRSRN